MKWKETIELPADDPLDAVVRLRKIKGVLSARMMNASRITVSFDNRKIQGKVVAKRCQPTKPATVLKQERRRA